MPAAFQTNFKHCIQTLNFRHDAGQLLNDRLNFICTDFDSVAFNCPSYADDLVLLSIVASASQEGIQNLNTACVNHGIKISVGKTNVVHVGKVRMKLVCALIESNLEQVFLIKYLGCTFSEDVKLERKVAERKSSGEALHHRRVNCAIMFLVRRNWAELWISRPSTWLWVYELY